MSTSTDDAAKILRELPAAERPFPVAIQSTNLVKALIAALESTNLLFDVCVTIRPHKLTPVSLASSALGLRWKPDEEVGRNVTLEDLAREIVKRANAVVRHPALMTTPMAPDVTASLTNGDAADSSNGD